MQTRLYTDNIPVYLDVYNSLYKDIMDRTYPPGEYLPWRNCSISEIWCQQKYSSASSCYFARRWYDY